MRCWLLGAPLVLSTIPACTDSAGSSGGPGERDGSSDASVRDSAAPTDDGAAAGGAGGSATGDSGPSMDDGAAGARSCDRVSALSGDDVEWEILPPLADGATDHAGQSRIFVDAAGVVYVVGSFATAPDWSPPWRVEVHRYDGTAWEIVGGGPAYSGTSGFGSIALDGEGNVYVLVQGSPEPVLLVAAPDGGSWDTVAPPSGDTADIAISHLSADRSGSILVMLTDVDGESAEVHRREEGGWQRLGAAIHGTEAVQFGYLRGELSADCEDRIAARLGGEVFWYDGDEWESLGGFDADGTAEFPRMSVGSDAQPIVAWRVDGNLLSAARYDRTGGAFVELDSPFRFASDASYVVPVVDDDNRAFLTWREENVILAHLEGEAWAPFIGDGDVASGFGTLPDIALSPDGLPAVVWEGADPDQAEDLQLGIARVVPRP